MMLRDFVADVLAWWRWELAEMLGLTRSRALSQMDVISVGAGGTDLKQGVRTRRGKKSGLAPDLGLLELKEVLRKHVLRYSRSAVILENDRVLWRELAPFRLPLSRAEKMARIDFQSETPFDAGEFAILIPEYRRDERESRYCIIRVKDVAPLRGLGRHVQMASLGVLEDGNVRWITRRSARRLFAKPASTLNAVRRAVLVASTLAGLVVYGANQWRLFEAARTLKIEIAASEGRIAALRRENSYGSNVEARQMDAFLQKASAVSLSAVLEDLAANLPDHTWLTSVEFSGADISITGLSADAAALIPLLDAAPRLSDPIFSEPVVPTQEGHRFSLTIGTESEIRG